MAANRQRVELPRFGARADVTTRSVRLLIGDSDSRRVWLDCSLIVELRPRSEFKVHVFVAAVLDIDL